MTKECGNSTRIAGAWRALARGSILIATGGLLVVNGAAHAGGPQPSLAPPYADDYTLVNLGSVPGLPEAYGGLTFLAGDPDTILIGGEANDVTGAIYSVGVARDGAGHIVGFSGGSATFFADAPYIDGGLAYGPEDVLFTAPYNPPFVEVGQIKPGSNTADKIVNLGALGVGQPLGGLNFVPPGISGGGQLKATSYDDGNWYTIGLAADGTGTYNATSATLQTELGEMIESFAFIRPGAPEFTTGSVLVNEYGDDLISAFELDGNGDPMVASRREFITGLDGPEGAVLDPLTGDFLFSEYDGARVMIVRGFGPPTFVKGDNNCDTLVNGGDALSGFLAIAGLPAGQQPGCPALGEPASVGVAVPAGDGGTVFGDMDCDSHADTFDALLILRFFSDLRVDLPGTCQPIGG